MNSSHNEIVFGNQNAKCFVSVSIVLIGVQMMWEAYIMMSDDINMRYTYPIYLILDIIFFIPQVLCLCAFVLYKNEDRKVRRSFVPMASLIMIGFSVIYLFQSVFMLLKNQNKSFTVTGRGDSFKKPPKKDAPTNNYSGRYHSSNRYNSFNSNNDEE
jgi:cation transport ATPase